MSGHGDNSVAREQLRSIVDRIERIEEEIAERNADKRDVYAEAKANGFDVKVLKKVVADRRKDSAEREEFETIYHLYAAALGMVHDFDIEFDDNVSRPEKPNDFSRAPARAREKPIYPVPHSSMVDGGQPNQTPDQVAQKADGVFMSAGQDCDTQSLRAKQSGKQDALKQQVGNEAGSCKNATASISDDLEMPEFLKRNKAEVAA